MRLFTLTCIALAILSPLALARKAVFAGGGLDDNNTQVYGAFVNLSTPAGQEPYIGIITAASDPTDAEDNGQFYINIFQTAPLQVKNIEWLPIDINHTSNADDPALAAKLEKMTGVFFGGGDQERLITCFYRNGREDTVTLAAIRKQYEAGLMAVGGTSAGTTIMQATPMVSGGESWDGLAYGAFNASDASDDDALTYDAGGGFRFFTYGFMDTHFATRGREGRMIRLMSDLRVNGTYGVGVDENTALVMNGDTFEVVGYNGAYIYDTSNCDLKQTGPEGAFAIENIKISYLTYGDVFNLTDGTVTFASFKQNIRGREQNADPMDPTIDIFSSLNNFDQNGDRMFPEMFTNVTTNLFNSAASNITHGYTWETNPGFRVDFAKEDDSAGVIGVYEGVTYISYHKLTTSVNCVSNCGSSFLGIKRHHAKTAENEEKSGIDLQEVFGKMDLPGFLFGDLL